MREPRLCWVDGAWVPVDAPGVRPDDSAFSLGRGCYTTARSARGEVHFRDRHVARLVRDARRLGLGEVPPALAAEALEATGRANFARDEDGVVRVQASRDGAGHLHLVALPRSPGHEPSAWRACTAPMTHEGPMPWSGVKVTNHLLFVLAAEHADRQGCQEALLLDREGYLVEGSRSNLLVVGADGRLATPDLARGGVAGVGLEVLRERLPEIAVRHVAGSELPRAREIVAVNAVRGPRPVVELDGRRVGDGSPGPIARRLAACFEAP